MPTTVVHSNQISATLFVSLEMSKDDWKLTFAVTGETRLRRRAVAAGSLPPLLREIESAKQALRIPAETPVISCYEAGRDGFWLHRALVASGIDNRVLDASSLEVDRRRKQAKTDRLDGERLVRALMRYVQGDRLACRVVHVPSREDEDARQMQRELQTLRGERTAHRNQMQSLLFAQGIRCEVEGAGFEPMLAHCETGDGHPLPPGLRQRLLRSFARLRQCVEQIRAIEEERDALFRAAEERSRAGRQDGPAHEAIAVRLFELRGVGDECAWTFATELFGWRNFRNRRQLGAVLGLTPVPYASGQMNQEQGLSKTGNSRLRALTIELAWLWLRYQTDSELTKWYQQRFATGNRRVRRIGIVALARKLMVALWKWVEQGEVPSGAVLKTPEQRRRHRRTRSLTARGRPTSQGNPLTETTAM